MREPAVIKNINKALQYFECKIIDKICLNKKYYTDLKKIKKEEPILFNGIEVTDSNHVKGSKILIKSGNNIYRYI